MRLDPHVSLPAPASATLDARRATLRQERREYEASHPVPADAAGTGGTGGASSPVVAEADLPGPARLSTLTAAAPAASGLPALTVPDPLLAKAVPWPRPKNSKGGPATGDREDWLMPGLLLLLAATLGAFVLTRWRSRRQRRPMFD